MIIQAHSQTFCVCGGGVQIGQILGPFMITHGLSCDRVGFGHLWRGGGGVIFSLTTPPLPTGLLSYYIF